MAALPPLPLSLAVAYLHSSSRHSLAHQVGVDARSRGCRHSHRRRRAHRRRRRRGRSAVDSPGGRAPAAGKKLPGTLTLTRRCAVVLPENCQITSTWVSQGAVGSGRGGPRHGHSPHRRCSVFWRCETQGAGVGRYGYALPTLVRGVVTRFLEKVTVFGGVGCRPTPKVKVWALRALPCKVFSVH